MSTASDEHHHIALLAYAYWERRGRPVGSPEVDWLHAVETLRVEHASHELPLSAFTHAPSR